MRKNGLGSDWGSKKYKHLSPAARIQLRDGLMPKHKAREPACLNDDLLKACNELKMFNNTNKLEQVLEEFRSGTSMLVSPKVGEYLVQKAIMGHRLAQELFEAEASHDDFEME